MDYTIQILIHDGSTELHENAHWVKYECRDNNGTNILVSWIIANNNMADIEIIKSIEAHVKDRGGIDMFPGTGVLDYGLGDLILECHGSDNEMFFVENDNEEKYNHDAIQNDIDRWNLGEYIRFDEDDAYITVYGGITSVINWR